MYNTTFLDILSFIMLSGDYKTITVHRDQPVLSM